ncbi:MAG: fibronectin type III domain-containing protein [Muribaculaceae bacterium]|nr:fibronectin type III domain-containing protein [Muribaculaceae bacterium]
MKRKLLHLFAICMAMVTAIPIANAAQITFSVNTTPLWKKEGTYNGAKTIAVSNDKLYLLLQPSTDTGIMYVGQNTNWTSFDSGYGTWAHGFAFDNDDAGNIVMQGNSTGSATTKLVVYPAGATSNSGKKEITITSPGGRTDYFRIQGNILSGKAYVWFVPQNTQNIIRVNIENGKEVGQTTWTHTLGANSSTELAYMLDDGRIFLHHRKGSPNYAYILTVPANGGAVTASEEILSGNGASNLTSDVFNIQGTYFYVYNAGNTTQDIRFNVKNLATEKDIATNITPFDGKKTDGTISYLSEFNSVGTIMRPIKVNVNTVDLYCYTPEHGASVYRVLANIVAEAANSISASRVEGTIDNIKVSWTKPTNDEPTSYAVSYSNNGGSTWSSDVKTTNLTHTFTGLAPGTYTFRVVPYYEQYLTYGGEKTSNSVELITCTDPVTNVTVAYAGNLGNSIVVSWDAPNGVIAPSKYQVCYSTNGGTSWTTPVETQNLTYTFADLSIGTYTFKVTPIYNGFPGDDAISESISVAEATGFTFTTEMRWEVRGTLGTDEVPAGKSIAVSNSKMYVAAPNKYGTISYVSESLGRNPASWPNFSSGFDGYKWGYAMDNDDAGNIIAKTGSGPGSVATQFSVYPTGATSADNKKEIILTGDYLPTGRFDFIAAQGDIYNGTGYIWFAPNGVNEIKKIKIENKSGTLTPTEITTWTHSLTPSNQIVLRPLSDGRLYYHRRTDVCAFITLPEGGGEIPSGNIKRLELNSIANSNLNSDAFILRGNTFQVRNDGAATNGIGIEIKNLTSENEKNGDAIFTPFNGLTPADGNSLIGMSPTVDQGTDKGYGSLVRSIKVDDDNYDIYCYSPNHGVTVYRVTAKASYIKTDKLASLSYQYVENHDGNNKVQDIELTWVAPANAAPSSYKIYRNGSLLKTVDASTLTYTDKGVTQNYTYKVVPIFIGANENASLGLEVTTTEVESVLYAPIITDVRNYDGYSIVEIFWQMPSYNKISNKHFYFNVYRDGVLLETGITQYNFIDDQLPKISEDVKYTYTIEAVYSATYDNATHTSEGKVVEVTARDWGLSGYQLQEIYNIPVSPAIGNLPNNFTNFEYYRQGHFYNGSWYIAQRSDFLAKKDDPNVPSSDVDKYNDIKSANADATGGVVQIKANADIDIYSGFTANKPITSEAFASVGLAMDDAGNIFMRHNNSNAGLAETAPTIDRITGLPVNWLTYISDGFTRRITRGAIYKHKGDGTYETEPTIINLDPLWTSNDWINTMAFTYQNGSSGDKNGQVTGRSDYYNMYGDVMSAEGGFILISPSWTHCIFKVKVANGEYVNHETHDIKEYQSAEGQVNVKTGTENYGFKIDGRNAWVAQIRSNGYFGIHGEEDHAGEGEEAHEHITHAIFVADSRINNTGGTSIVAFNSAEGANDGETFLITPASMYSRNYGDFIVTRGTKTNVNDLASEAKFMPPMPVAQMKQTNINDNIATNANGNWFHAEVGTYTGTSGEEEECVDIYQYVPGIRFAKYRLVSDLTLPVVSPTLEITTAYNDDNTEITHFNGKSTWQRPEGFATTDPDNASVWIKSYSFELLDAHGNVVYSDEVPEAKDADGNPVIDYSFDYVTDKGIDNVDNCDLDFQTYTARIAVNYEFKSGEIQQSSYNYAIASNDYDAEKASDLAVYVFKKEKVTEYVWVENPNTTETTEDDWVAVPKEFDTYRVELDFNPPAWSADANPEPISYYTVKALVNNQTDLIEITDFHLHTGAEVVNGVEKATYEVASQIPGTYNFSQYNKGGNKAPYYHTVGKDYGVGGESRRAGVLTWHHKVDYGQYTGGVATTAEGDEIVITDEPNKWVFIVEAHYGAKNRYIAKSAEASIGVEDQKYIETGVEVVGDNTAALKIYPIPATTSITVKASEAINSIVIYNEAGVEVINEMGNGENITMVNIEKLSTGFYFVKVNNYEPVKIIKK